MAAFSVTLPSGELWTPRFVTDLNQEKCIGCARCVRVCAREVLALVGVTEDGDIISIDPDSDEEEEYEKKVMTIAHPGKLRRLRSLLEGLPQEVLHPRGRRGVSG